MIKWSFPWTREEKNVEMCLKLFFKIVLYLMGVENMPAVFQLSQCLISNEDG